MNSGSLRKTVIGITCAVVGACKYDWPLESSPSPVSAEGGTTTCEKSLFCDSFDEGRIDKFWTRSYVGAGANVGIEPSPLAPSAPNVLLTSVPARSTTPSNYAYVARNLVLGDGGASLRNATLTFSIRPERYDDHGHACVGGFVFGEGTGRETSLRVLMGQKDGIVEEIVDGKAHPFPFQSPPAQGAWTKIELSTGVGGRIMLRVGETLALDASADPGWQPSDSLRFVVGVNFYDETPTSGFSFRFDDVQFDGD